MFGTRVDTPLGRQDPSRAVEAAAYIRQAISHAMPRDEIVKGIAGGYGAAGTMPIAWLAPEYDHDPLKPTAYDRELAKSFMRKAGYTVRARAMKKRQMRLRMSVRGMGYHVSA